MASAHALHGLHHVGVGPVPPAGVFVLLVAHGHLDAGQHAAGQDRSHAGQSETTAHKTFLFNQDNEEILIWLCQAKWKLAYL